MIRLKFAALLLFAISLIHVPKLHADDLVIASWNCENLFDTEDDPNVKGDEEYTPDGPKKWTKEKLDIKLTNLGNIIKKMNSGKGPDVLGVCEVENRKVVEMLVEKLQPLGRKYEIIHKDSPSERGIDCAIIYDSAVFTLADSKFHHVDAGDTRDIVEAKLHRKDNDLYVFMDHWPSKFHKPEARDKAGDTARKRIDEILAADPKADIMMLGDFNDESTDESIKDHLRTATTSDNLPAGTMFDTTAKIKEAGSGTFFFHGHWDMLDHILISPGLLDHDGFHWKEGSSERVEFPELFYQPKFEGAQKIPSSSYTKNTFHENGYSDHLPVECVIEQ